MRWKAWGSGQGVDRGLKNHSQRMECAQRFEDLFKV